MKNEITIDEWLAEFDRVNVGDAEAQLYKKAVVFVVDHQKAGTPYLAAGLEISQYKAQILLSRMELDGVISEAYTTGCGPKRRVLLKRKENI